MSEIMAKFTDLNGIWTGSFGYPVPWKESVSFTAWIDDQAGSLSGTILEPNTFADTAAEELSATVNGARTGIDISFTKVYEPGQGAHAHEIEYSGKANSDLTWITGQWRIGGWIEASGSFEMSRQSGAFETAEKERAVELVE